LWAVHILTSNNDVGTLDVVGRMRKNHHIPKSINCMAQNLKRREMTYDRCGDILETQVVNMV
jgi:hypothetical protein